MTPAAASRPNAEPPASSTAWTFCTRCIGRSRSVSRVPGAPPRWSTPPTAPFTHSTTVQPVRARSSPAWPTWIPGTSVMAFLRCILGLLANPAVHDHVDLSPFAFTDSETPGSRGWERCSAGGLDPEQILPWSKCDAESAVGAGLPSGNQLALAGRDRQIRSIRLIRTRLPDLHDGAHRSDRH